MAKKPNNNGSHKFTQEQRIIMIHALKLYYNRVHSYLQALPDGSDLQKDYFTREAVHTMLMIEKFENRL